MRGVPREQSLGYREEATRLLEENFRVLHAMRGRELKETMPDPKGAVIRDKMDIDQADIVLVNDSYTNVSNIGTAMEIMYSWERGKAVIIFGEEHLHDYWMNFHSHLRFKNLEEACHFINKMFK